MKKEMKPNVWRKGIQMICGIFAVILLCGFHPGNVWAFEAENSFLYVGGTYMVRDGKLLTTTVNGQKGTAVYDEAANTLTLDNIELTCSTTIGMQNMSGLKIILKGTNTLNAGVDAIYARQKGMLTLSGGSLKINSGSREQQGTGVVTGIGDLVIENCDIEAVTTWTSIASKKNMTIKNSNITTKRIGMNLNENDYYNSHMIFQGFQADKLAVTNSTLDITGYNVSMCFLQPAVYDEKVTITDETGAELHLVKLSWPEIAASGEWEYVYSRSNAGTLYTFDETARRVIIKSEPVKEEIPDNNNNQPDNNNDQPDNNNDQSDNNNNQPDVPPEKPSTQKEKAKKYKVKGAYYYGKLSSGKVAYAGPVKKGTKSITIPATVKIKGKTCKVTSIHAKAMKNCKSLTTLKIGKNVKTIGKEACYNCKKLKKIIITGKNLKTVEKNAFKNTRKKAAVQVPKSKYQAYKKILKGKGLKSPVYKKK